jgi:hypothetical protein
MSVKLFIYIIISVISWSPVRQLGNLECRWRIIGNKVRGTMIESSAFKQFLCKGIIPPNSKNNNMNKFFLI